ncbi:unnamed protein product [Chrysodeixis includens]|uniref:Uncharacterized protein n=1 Tax=Chrysodeixis includens TaxID=689277 RepID=A0A9N8KVL7_CHRIL|nr:unnamed protein product [Chrysodeixis includens]
MYLYAAKLLKVHVCHRFLEKGHTQQEGDSVHALIERSSKRKMIYTPLEWYTCVRWCKGNEKPYEVIEVSANDILDFKSHTNQYTWTKNLNNEKVKWNQIRVIKVDPSDPYVMHYKYDLNEAQSMSIDCRRRAYTRNRQNNVEPLNSAYTNALPITTAKYKDLISLCEKNLIPSRYHSFYKNIAHTATENKENTNSDEED